MISASLSRFSIKKVDICVLFGNETLGTTDNRP